MTAKLATPNESGHSFRDVGSECLNWWNQISNINCNFKFIFNEKCSISLELLFASKGCLWSSLFDNFIDRNNAITVKPFSMKVTPSNVFYSITNI